jgi:predicted transcriptional regulator
VHHRRAVPEGVTGNRTPGIRDQSREGRSVRQMGRVQTMRVFGELETVVMDRLWAANGHGTVREVFEVLRSEREIAYTTVLSTMENLHRKGHLIREREGQAFRYRTVLSHVEHTSRLMREAMSQGEQDTTAVLAHFVAEMSPRELAELKDVIRRRGKAAPKR